MFHELIPGKFGFWCPACSYGHPVVGCNRLQFDGVVDRGWDANTKIRGKCHYRVTNGLIQFYTDSTHHLTGKVVDLPDWPSEDRQLELLFDVD